MSRPNCVALFGVPFLRPPYFCLFGLSSCCVSFFVVIIVVVNSYCNGAKVTCYFC